LELYQKSNSNKADIASILNNIGLNYIDMNLADNAIDSFQNSLETYRRIESKNSFIIADILNNIGKAYLILDDHEKSLEYFTQSLEIIKYLEENETNSRKIAIILYNIGGCYFSLKKFRFAIENYDSLNHIKENAILTIANHHSSWDNSMRSASQFIHSAGLDLC
jgi:tetratricopeptide (TPR) repeat protein